MPKESFLVNITSDFLGGLGCFCFPFFLGGLGCFLLSPGFMICRLDGCFQGMAHPPLFLGFQTSWLLLKPKVEGLGFRVMAQLGPQMF